MELLKKKLEESLEQIDLLIEEKDNLKDRYEDVKVYIGKMKDKINHLKATKAPSEKNSSNYDTEGLKEENEILEHELKIVELKLSLKGNGSKSDSDLKFENANLRSQLSQVTSKLDSIKMEHAKLEKV